MTTKYRVALVQKVWDEATVFVDAETSERAEEIARQMANDGLVEWRFLEAPDPVEIVSVDEATSLSRPDAGDVN